MFQTEVVEKLKTHISFVSIFSPENRIDYDIMRKKIVELGRPQMTIWRMRIACWIPKATNTHSEYAGLFEMIVIHNTLEIAVYVFFI